MPTIVSSVMSNQTIFEIFKTILFITSVQRLTFLTIGIKMLTIVEFTEKRFIWSRTQIHAMNLTSSQHTKDVSSWCYKKLKGQYSVECAPWRTLWVTRCRIHANVLLFWHVQHGSWNALHLVPRPQKKTKNVAFGRDWLLLWVISGSDQGVGAVFHSMMSRVSTKQQVSRTNRKCHGVGWLRHEYWLCQPGIYQNILN